MKGHVESSPARVRGRFRRLSRVFPRIAGRMFARIWFTPSLWSPPVGGSIPPGARRVSFRWQRTTIDGFSLGEGERTALLVHGWAGSSLQYGPLAIQLAASGYVVTAIDLPGHGLSSGSSTDILEIADAIDSVARAVGPLDLVVAHSLGVSSTVLALQSDLQAKRLVAISPGVVPRQMLEKFVSELAVDSRVVPHLESNIERRIGPGTLDRVATEILNGAVPEQTLIIHDRDDRLVSVDVGRDLAAAWARPITVTSGYGHTRILSASEVIEMIVDGNRSRDVDAQPAGYA